jgi:alpha-galactosidase
MYKEYVDTHPEGTKGNADMEHWANAPYKHKDNVKFELFRRYGVIAAAGDRHLAEFCPGKWFLASPSMVIDQYKFSLTTVEFRKKELVQRKQKALDYYNGKPFQLRNTGEETVRQIKALLGLGDFVTNVNIPNVGQVENNPLGVIVETNAAFSGDSVRPVHAGRVPDAVNALVMRIIEEQEVVVDAVLTGDYEKAFVAFLNNPNMPLPVNEARELFNKMLTNTKKYLPHYEEYMKTQQ